MTTETQFDREAFLAPHREKWESLATRYVRDAFKDNEEARRTGDMCLPPDRFAGWLLSLDVEKAYRREYGDHLDRAMSRAIADEFVKPAWDAYWKEQA